MKQLLLFSMWISLILAMGCRDTASTTNAHGEANHADAKMSAHVHMTVSSTMVNAANTFLASLDEDQRKMASFEAKEDEKYDWHFVPQDDRKGVLLRELNSDQRAKAQALMQSVLSDQGFAKAEAIRNLELVLREIEDRPDDDWYRNPEKYYFSIFGTPSQDQDWGWRMEGHHLSLSFSGGKDAFVSVTPSFMGTNPAIVRKGSKKGTEVLKEEQDQGRAFVKSLSEEQFTQALMDPKAPGDVITFVDRVVKLEDYLGLPASEMTADQQAALRQLLSVYTNNMEAEIAEDQWTRIEKEGFGKLYFAWAGGTEQGEGHYYRIHGPTILVEYDNVQNDNNHIHVVWRDLQYDFGGDLLKKHHEEHDH